MKSKVSYRIRKLRESKDLKQGHVADELNITVGAYSKIERGVTDPSVGRLAQIAKILNVDVTYFFHEGAEPFNMEEGAKLYGFATKSDLEEITITIRQLRQEMTVLKKEVAAIHATVPKRKKL